MSAGAEITVAAAAKTFPDGTRALHPTDLTVARGETLVLLGPSGCGKTTLLRLIAGLETPDAGGRILFDGRDVTALPIERREVGMVFQSYALFPNMNVIDNVAYGLRVKGVGKAARREEAARYLELCRIGELAGRRITELSGGQRQRVALARALVVKPRLLLLDEPLTALDANLRETLRGEIDALLRSLAITSIYVTHDQAEAMMLGDRIAVMEKGRIAQIGTPREIYAAPASRFVAEFVGVSNRIEGRVAAGRFHTEHGSIAAEGLADGPATIHFRPDDAALADPSPGAAGDGLAFEVAKVVYLGSGQLVTLKGLSAIRILVPAHHPVAAGERIGFTLSPDRIKVFP
ncbi:ABC transporter ATP-binding protein [Acuticoccus sediminis]|uniref:ABC transporter ATP-binding protein n=1 Tax=Acuticoccus sediminis TaxID=2184697 RepID=A0A8B2NQT5_9HYPH|nr:ABC transporter ATP-binding protein [Acuticoccus sediminis]RAI02246.1 ABC transporter ATP-binding protein [Acuticoccus sediminis]